MTQTPNRLEQTFFRLLNRVVEPAVRKGIGSPRFAPAGLILLETTGFKTGRKRSTPLLAMRLGRYLLVSTARGGRSFWVKNLENNANTHFYLGGRLREAEAFVVSPNGGNQRPSGIPRVLASLIDSLLPLTNRGFAFALLAPRT